MSDTTDPASTFYCSEKPRVHCVLHSTLMHACGCTAMPSRRCHMSMQDTADAKLYATYCCCQWAQLHCRIWR